MNRPKTPTLKQAERALVRAYLITRGRGKQWRAVQRAVALFVASAATQSIMRVLVFGSTMGLFILQDLSDGKLDGFVRVLRELTTKV